MVIETAAVVAKLTPYLVSAARSFGEKVLEKIQDQTADATGDAAVGFGQRVLGLLIGRKPGLTEAVTDVATDSSDGAEAQLSYQLTKALKADPDLLGELAKLLDQAPPPSQQTVITQSATADNGGIVNQAGGDIEYGSSSWTVSTERAQGVQIGDSNTQNNTF